MTPFLKSRAIILLTPSGGWSWSGWDGRLTVYSQKKTVNLSKDNIILEADVPRFTLIVPRQYVTTAYPIPGLILTSVFTVDQSTLSDKIKVDSQQPLLLSTTGAFTCTVAFPASRPTITAPFDMVVQKSGTWKVVNANQTVSVRNKDGFVLKENSPFIQAQIATLLSAAINGIPFCEKCGEDLFD